MTTVSTDGRVAVIDTRYASIRIYEPVQGFNEVEVYIYPKEGYVVDKDGTGAIVIRCGS